MKIIKSLMHIRLFADKSQSKRSLEDEKWREFVCIFLSENYRIKKQKNPIDYFQILFENIARKREKRYWI